MKIMGRFLTVVTLVAIFALPSLAQEGEEHGMKMPEMGPTEEIKAKAFLVGTWDVKNFMKESPEQEEWTEFPAVAVYSYTAGGGAIQFTYKSGDMGGGVDFEGFYMEAYNRNTGKWQSVWTDNISSSISYMEGEETDGEMVMHGEDKFMGQTRHNRMTVSNTTETSFDWKMDVSMDGGETYFTTMKSTYTKRK
jgi:hypothetical protein